MLNSIPDIGKPHVIAKGNENVLHTKMGSRTQNRPNVCEHIQDSQRSSSCIDDEGFAQTKNKRVLLRKLAGCAPLEPEMTLRDLRNERLVSKV